MKAEYKHNHYVPEWYQKRFVPAGSSKYFYLDLKPDVIVRDGHRHVRNALLNWGPSRCFAQDDLYTTRWSGLENRDIEKFFFGQIDTESKGAVELFSNFELNDKTIDAFGVLLPYMSLQKLRTPKGLAWLRSVTRTLDKNQTLIELQRLRNLFCTIWGEGVWQIADATNSPTKFIISDHPVVVYNRECPPGSAWCLGFNDPDIRSVASHTYFPLSQEKILIITNLSWVRNPYQNALKFRPNPKFLRGGSPFNVLDIQHERFLTEEEVLEINYVTKKRAFRYIAAGKEDWLYPERHLSSTSWHKLGDGYLLMPDPRHVHGGGEIYIGYKDGSSAGWGAYGHRPWQRGFKDEARERQEWQAMDRFKAEWAAMQGRDYRGVIWDIGRPDPKTRRSMGEDYHVSECARDREYLKKPGERARRRRLRR